MEEPATFEILGNMRILMTSLLLRGLLKRKLHKYQWVALLLLCIGTATSQLVTCGNHIILTTHSSAFVLTLFFCFLSAFAGVYTEYLFKKRSGDSLYLQNLQLYFYGMFFNGLVLFLFYSSDVRRLGIVQLAGSDWVTVLLVLNQALTGLAISAIVKFADNISKIYAHSLSLVLTMTISSIIQQTLPSMQLIFGSMIVTISVWLYYSASEMEEKVYQKIELE